MGRMEHPSYGMLRLTRSTVSGEGTALFGSSIMHNNVIRLTISRGEVIRGGSIDRYLAKEEKEDRIVEVEMSYTQFAEMVTSFNVGDGVPVTITNIGGQYIAPCPVEDRKGTMRKEAEETIDGILTELETRMEEIDRLLGEKRVLSKDDRNRILSVLGNVRRTLASEIPGMYKLFRQQLEETVAEARGEFESYLLGRMEGIAMSAISGHMAGDRPDPAGRELSEMDEPEEGGEAPGMQVKL